MTADLFRRAMMALGSKHVRHGRRHGIVDTEKDLRTMKAWALCRCGMQFEADWEYLMRFRPRPKTAEGKKLRALDRTMRQVERGLARQGLRVWIEDAP